MNLLRKTILKRISLFVFIAVILSSIFITALTSCGGDDNSTTKIQIPTASDFIITGIGKFSFNGEVKTVTIKPKEGKSTGKISIYYNGQKNEPPFALGSHTVTFDVAASPDGKWAAKTGLEAGTITIVDKNDNPVIPLIENKWDDGNLVDSDDEQWFLFTATAATQYIHFNAGSLSTVTIQLYDNNEAPLGNSSILSGSGYSDPSYVSRTLTSGSEYFIKVTVNPSYSSTGTFSIGFTKTTTPPSSFSIPTTNVTPLTTSIWADGNLTSSGSQQWFKFTAEAASHYIHFSADTLQYVYIQLYDSTGVAVGDQSTYSDGYYLSRTVTIGSEYYIRVMPYDGSGTYKITFNTSSTPPAVLPTSFTTLVENKWADGNLAASDNGQWFKFRATASTQYIHFNPGSLQSVYVHLYDSNGAQVGNSSSDLGNYYGNYSTTKTVTSGNDYYIRVSSNNNDGGRYEIGFTSASTIPTLALPQSPSSVTTISNTEWTDGSIAASAAQQWFKFTATSATQYIYFDPGTLNEVYIQIYSEGGDINLRTNSLSATNLSAQATLTKDDDFYVRVIPKVGGSGAYKIRFGTLPFSPNTTVTQLTEKTWANGNITASGGQQWFKFTSKGTTQYINFDPGTLNSVYVQLYNETGTTVGEQSYLYDSTTSISRTVTNNSLCYIMVKPYNNTGTYRISFSASPMVVLPTANVTTLESNKWKDGNITGYSDIQWYKFTASSTAAHYIYIDFGTLSNVYVQLYDSTGTGVGDQASLSSSNSSTSQSLTNNNAYYIKVTPNSSYGSSSGTYKIGYNTSTTKPPVTLPQNFTSLTTDTWTDGNITSSSGEQWFKFTTSGDTQYINFSSGTLQGISIQLYDSTGINVGATDQLYNISNYGTQTYISRTVTNGNTYYLKVTPYSAYSSSSSGTYNILIGNSTAIVLPTTGVTQLTLGKWADGNFVNSSSIQWYKFTATASSQYIHIDSGANSNVNIQLYDSNGITVGDRSQLSNSTNNTSQTVTSGKDYYIKAMPNSYSSKFGRFEIGFTSSSSAKPTLTVPSSDVNTLAVDTWTNGSITSAAGQQWFKFNATAVGGRSVFFDPTGTLNEVIVQICDTTGNVKLNLTDLYDTTLTASLDVETGDYYIRVLPKNVGGSGDYKIRFGILPIWPGTTVTTLVESKWTDGNITSTNNEQWYKFTATVTGNQYINFNPGTSNRVYVRLYDSTGKAPIQNETITNYVNYTVTSGSEYYLKVTLYGSNTGTYKIMFSFSTAIILPTANVKQITAAGTWIDGNLTDSSSQEWYKFTATSTTSYIFQSGLNYVYGYLFDENGIYIEGSYSYISNNSYLSRSTQVGKEYYFRVSADGSYYGAYKVALSTTTTKPSE